MARVRSDDLVKNRVYWNPNPDVNPVTQAAVQSQDTNITSQSQSGSNLMRRARMPGGRSGEAKQGTGGHWIGGKGSGENNDEEFLPRWWGKLMIWKFF